MYAIKPIKTCYRGVYFRSKLESEWAKFFDSIGISWQYELEGYDLGDRIWYLPDFWLPDHKLFAEVKPVKFSETEYEKCERLVQQSGFGCLLLAGTPSIESEYSIIHVYKTYDESFHWNTTTDAIINGKKEDVYCVDKHEDSLIIILSHSKIYSKNEMEPESKYDGDY